MEVVLLQRLSDTPHGMFGALIRGDTPLILTLENNWLDNKKYISCIPAGEYFVDKYSSVKYPNVWEIKDVIGRTHILFHAGNWQKDTKGCVLVGDRLIPHGIGNSKATLDRMRDEFPDQFKLLILNPLKGEN